MTLVRSNLVDGLASKFEDTATDKVLLEKTRFVLRWCVGLLDELNEDFCRQAFACKLCTEYSR